MAQSNLQSDLLVNGTIYASGVYSNSATINDSMMAANAGVDASKLDHLHQLTYSQKTAVAAAADRHVIHTVRGATGTVVSFKCGSVVAATGDSTTTFKLKKNGSDILSSNTVLDSGNTAYILENAAGFTSTALTAGDVLEVDVTVSAGTGSLPTGVFCTLAVSEDY